MSQKYSLTGTPQVELKKSVVGVPLLKVNISSPEHFREKCTYFAYASQ